MSITLKTTTVSNSYKLFVSFVQKPSRITFQAFQSNINMGWDNQLKHIGGIIDLYGIEGTHASHRKTCENILKNINAVFQNSRVYASKYYDTILQLGINRGLEFEKAILHGDEEIARLFISLFDIRALDQNERDTITIRERISRDLVSLKSIPKNGRVATRIASLAQGLLNFFKISTIPTNSNTCKECLEGQVEMVNVPCGHMFTCQKCALKIFNSIKKCTHCEKPLEMVVKAIRLSGEKLKRTL